MSTFVKGVGTGGTPFGRNEFLRSTNPKPQTESYTLAASTVPARTINGFAGQKILQPGTAMAAITSGADIGKIGPFQFYNANGGGAGIPTGAVDGRGVAANLVGLELTFLPWQTIERDVEVSVVTNGTCVQAWCKELDNTGAEILLSNTTADAMRGGKRLDINFS